MTSRRPRQCGAALIVSLIMLLLISLLAVSSFRLSTGNLQIVRNMQQRGEEFAAAQAAVDQAISSTRFTATPADAIPNPCGGVANTICVDVNGDGVIDVNVQVSVACDSIQPIPVPALNFSAPNDAGCLIGVGQDFGVAGAVNNNSMCSNSVWNIQASATDVSSSANSVINEGAAVRVPATATCP